MQWGFVKSVCILFVSPGIKFVCNAAVSGIRKLKQCGSIQLLFIYKYAVSISSSRKSDWMGEGKKIWKSL